ncbi:adenosine deaminase 2-like [Leguminivora glycinivorella]|uniref:adenosine deaminase 2-like n=1 Tax=Leguminivora glycinivorella TaxID=1035111 RepID=UPI00200C6048|nr:adenosine deaminase 2-like [Leguminivora glycinivorella]
MITISVLFWLLFDQIAAEDIAKYMAERARTMEVDSQITLGQKLVLSEKKLRVNDKLMKCKNMDLDNSPNNTHYLDFSGSFFKYRDAMRRSKSYEMIRRMPKGASLHVHSSLMLDPDDLLKLTYEDHLYICLTENYLDFYFSKQNPKRNCSYQWSLLKELRKKHANVTQFDKTLKERLTLGPEDDLTDENRVWEEFEHIVDAISSLIEYRPVREKMIYQSLQNLYDDNILYVEIRIGLNPLYELNGTIHDDLYMVSLYDQVASKFMLANPDFAGLKLILASFRKVNIEKVEKDLNFARNVKQTLPDVFAGFDLVGQEDKGKTLKDYLPVLLKSKGEIDYFFHAGETNQFGTPVDENLFDAILLGTKRIGHGTALFKHPELIKLVWEKDIALEVNVISNSVLSLVKDLRSHPLAVYLVLGLPVVLSSDDPGVWGARPATDDVYVAFMAIASQKADLRMLKQLAMNSIKYSSLNTQRKEKLFETFEKKWIEFINYEDEIP